jgi:hypothetical protein
MACLSTQYKLPSVSRFYFSLSLPHAGQVRSSQVQENYPSCFFLRRHEKPKVSLSLSRLRTASLTSSLPFFSSVSLSISLFRLKPTDREKNWIAPLFALRCLDLRCLPSCSYYNVVLRHYY